MLFGDAVNVFLGLALTFGVIAGLSSAITELVASRLSWRSKTLLSGLKDMLNDPNGTGLVVALLNHATVNARSPGTNGSAETARAAVPSYMSSRQFADALIDIVHNPPAGPHPDFPTAIGKLGDPQLEAFLRTLHERTAGDMGNLRDELAQWFDASMDRLSGLYKRDVQMISFGVGLALAISLNIDAFHLAVALWNHSAIGPRALGEIGGNTPPTQALATLEGLFPLGWPLSPAADHWGVVGWAACVFGWLATAAATLFGAPFWFDLIQRFANIRGSGPVPAK